MTFVRDRIELRVHLDSSDDACEEKPNEVHAVLGPQVCNEEGRFARVDTHTGPTNLATLTTDPLGMRPVFVARDGARRVYTDSLQAAEDRVSDNAPDILGIASFVTLGWPLDDRTLLRAWRALPPGTHRITGDDRATATYSSSLDLRAIQRKRLDEVARDALARLRSLVEARFSARPDTVVQLTGGQDSRLILAICLTAGLRPRTRTRGRPDDLEVQIAEEVARRVGCEHEVEFEYDDLYAEPLIGSLTTTLLDRTDGMVSLWQLSDVRPRATVGQSNLGGIGGEIARRYWNSKSSLDRKATREGIVETFTDRLAKDPLGCLRPEIRSELRKAIHERARELASDLDDPRDLPDVFYAIERVRRWGGANARKLDPRDSTLPLLASRTFFDAALAVTPEERVGCALHAEIVRIAKPSLHRVPLLGSEWPCSRIDRFLRDRAARRLATGASASSSFARQRDTLVTHFAAELRKRVLDTPHSWLFDVFDRERLELATRPRSDLSSTIESSDSAKQALCAVWTVARYFEERGLRSTCPSQEGTRAAARECST